MRFRHIFIANLAEIAKPLLALIKDKKQARAEIFEDFGLCDRFLISDKDDRVLITSWPVDKDFLNDTCQIFGFKNILNLYPENPTVSLCDDILNDENLKKKVKEIIKRDKPALFSYAATMDFMKLIKSFKDSGLDFGTPETPKTKELISYFGSKAGFRETFTKEKIGQGLGMAMAKGFITKNRQEFIEKINFFYKNKKNFVVKTNQGLAGAGSKIIETDKVSFNHFLEVVKDYPYWLTGKTVIEEFIKADLTVCGGSPSVEFQVTDNSSALQNSGINYLYTCGMRIIKGGVFRGIETGKNAVPKWLGKKIKAYGFKFAAVLKKAGYRGFFDTDFVNTKDKKLYPLEANIRRTGGTHVYETGIRLLGQDFLKNYYLASNNLYENKTNHCQNYQQLKTKLSPLLYPIKGKKKGIILTMASLIKEKRFGYLVAGKNREEVINLEEQMSLSLV